MKIKGKKIILMLFLMMSVSLGITDPIHATAQNKADSGQEEAKLLLVSSEAAETGQQYVQTKIAAVTVYPDRASVIRKGQVTLNPGTRSLVFSNLPATIIPGSVRVTGRGSAAVRIIGVEVKTNYLEAEQLPEVKKLQEEVKIAETEIARLKGQEEVLDSQEKFLNSFGAALSNQVSKELVAGQPNLAGVDKFIEYLGSKLQSIQKGRLENSKLMSEKQARLEALKKKLREIMPARSKEEKNVNVLIEVIQAGRLEVELSYAVSPARWAPVYTIKALPESGEVQLTVAANVTQKTAENWEEVNLVLSTSSPTAGNQPGELQPWYLDISQPKTMKVMARDKAESKVMLETGALEAVAYEEPASIVETWFSVNFEIKKSWTILSDGSERRVPIDSQKLLATYDCLAMPKLQEQAFLRANFKNSLSYPFLPGKADLFIAEDFAGSTSLNFVPYGDKVKLFFGGDKQIKVKRQLLKREKSGPGFLGKTEKVRLVYQISVENLRNREIELELQDQVPVSQNARIEVKDVKIAPAPASRDERGLLTWEIKLEPKKKQEFIVDFTVEYPKDARIVGL